MRKVTYSYRGNGIYAYRLTRRYRLSRAVKRVAVALPAVAAVVGAGAAVLALI